MRSLGAIGTPISLAFGARFIGASGLICEVSKDLGCSVAKVLPSEQQVGGAPGLFRTEPFNPAGARVVAASDDNTALVWRCFWSIALSAGARPARRPRPWREPGAVNEQVIPKHTRRSKIHMNPAVCASG